MNFFKDLEKQILSHDDGLTELVDEAPLACLRIWTSALTLTPVGMEFCSILNAIVRNDKEKQIRAVMPIIRSITSLCALTRKGDVVTWPKDHTLYRGTGMPMEQLSFFKEEVKYRCPFFLATSLSKIVAHDFCRRASQQPGRVPVLFVVKLDPKFRCYHVNFIDKGYIPGESEFLFSPYSVFKVISVPDLSKAVNWMNPYVVILKAAVDNKIEPEDLPLCGWH